MWKKYSCYRSGLDHISEGRECQDRVLIKENDKHLVAALADGLGSLKFSEIAAEITTEEVCKFFLETDIDLFALKDLKQILIRRIKNAIFVAIKKYGIDEAELNCTLVFVSINKLDNSALVGYIGDSVIIVVKENACVAYNDSEMFANVTNSVLSENSFDNLYLEKMNIDTDKVNGFILASDGLEREIYMKGSNRAYKAAEIYFNAVSEHKQDSPKVEATINGHIDKLVEQDGSYDDDISIGVISRLEHGISFPEDPTWLCSCGARNALKDSYCTKCNKDFLALYKKINYEEKGGKESFFEYINKNPDEEKRLLGILEKNKFEQQKKKVVANDYNIDQSLNKNAVKEALSSDNNDVKMMPMSAVESDENEKKKIAALNNKIHRNCGRKRKAFIFGLFIGMVFGGGIAALICTKRISELKKELLSYKEVAISNMLANIETLMADKDTTQLNDSEIITTTEEKGSGENDVERRGEISNTVQMRTFPGNNGYVFGELIVGTTVLLSEEEIVNGIEWIKIQTEEGKNGWIEKSAVKIIE